MRRYSFVSREISRVMNFNVHKSIQSSRAGWLISVWRPLILLQADLVEMLWKSASNKRNLATPSGVLSSLTIPSYWIINSKTYSASVWISFLNLFETFRPLGLLGSRGVSSSR